MLTDSSSQSSSCEQPLRVLLAAETYPPNVNGAAQFAYRLAKGLVGCGHEVRIVTPRPTSGPTVSEWRPEGKVELVRSHAAATLPDFRISMWWDAARETRRIFDEFEPDVVHIQSQYFLCEMVLREAQKRGIRVVATNHTLPENLFPHFPFPDWGKRASGWILWRHAHWILGKADVLTVPTPLAARAHGERGGLEEILAISNGIDTEDYEAHDGDIPAEDGVREILFVGRLAGEKHVDVLIDAFALLGRCDVRLIIAGSGELEQELHQKAEGSHVAEKIQFLGFVADEELRQAYRRAAIFVMPGTAELQSLVTLEAMSAQTPVVAANAMALPHLVDEGANGFLFEPGNPQDLAQKLTKILDLSREQREAMGARSLQMAKSHSIEATLDRFVSLYRGQKVAGDS